MEIIRDDHGREMYSLVDARTETVGNVIKLASGALEELLQNIFRENEEIEEAQEGDK